MNNYIKLARPHQWVKNILIFLPAFFGFRMFEPGVIEILLLGFVFLGLVSSSVYVFNDLQDQEDDKGHPLKRYRPIPAGLVSTQRAKIFWMILMIIGIFGGYFINPSFGLILGVYLAINIAYSLKLKHFALLDILIISFGFLLRIIAGSILIEQPLSKWLILMTFLLSLFVAFGKRYDDILLLDSQGTSVRKSINGYSKEFIQLSITMLSSVLIVTYVLYTLSAEVGNRIDSDYMYFTAFPVVIAVLRYFQLVYVYNKSGEPVKVILKDLPMISLIIVWFLIFLYLLYF